MTPEEVEFLEEVAAWLRTHETCTADEFRQRGDELLDELARARLARWQPPLSTPSRRRDT
jgi:hypothetical protein